MEIIKVLTKADMEIDGLLEASSSEGYTMLESLYEDYLTKEICYLKTNECILIAMDEYGTKLGIVSLRSSDQDLTLGILDHHYVLPQYRNMGIGYELVDWIVRNAKDSYKTVSIIREVPAISLQFYLNRGFLVNTADHLTAILEKEDSTQ